MYGLALTFGRNFETISFQSKSKSLYIIKKDYNTPNTLICL